MRLKPEQIQADLEALRHPVRAPLPGPGVLVEVQLVDAAVLRAPPLQESWLDPPAAGSHGHPPLRVEQRLAILWPPPPPQPAHTEVSERPQRSSRRPARLGWEGEEVTQQLGDSLAAAASGPAPPSPPGGGGFRATQARPPLSRPISWQADTLAAAEQGYTGQTPACHPAMEEAIAAHPSADAGSPSPLTPASPQPDWVAAPMAVPQPQSPSPWPGVSVQLPLEVQEQGLHLEAAPGRNMLALAHQVQLWQQQQQQQQHQHQLPGCIDVDLQPPQGEAVLSGLTWQQVQAALMQMIGAGLHRR